MTKAIVPAELSGLLDAAANNLISDIIAGAEAKALQTEKRGSNAETRKAAHLAALVKANKKVKGCTADLAPITEDFHSYLTLSKSVSKFVENAAQVGLSDEEAILVLKQVMSGKLIKEVVDATYDAAKEAVWATMNIAFAEAGESDPEHVNGYLDVPELGKRFCREGAGRKDSEFDMDKLRAVVGDEVFEQITVAKVTYEVNDTALSAAILANPDLMEGLRDAVKVGDWKSPRLMIRDIPADEKE